MLCWPVAAILLAFVLFTETGVFLSFCAQWRVSPLVAPIALFLALLGGDWLIRRDRAGTRLRIITPFIALAIVGASLLLSGLFFDLSWDGLWYHQTAIYQMAHGWNPVYDPMRGFVSHIQDAVRHYAKGSWYFALAVFAIIPNIEWAKPGPWIAFAAMFFTVLAAALEFGLRKRNAAALAGLVSLNPVVVCELPTYLVDGMVISFLTSYAAAGIANFRRPSFVMQSVMAASAILAITTKFSALVFLCFFCAAGGLYLILKQRQMLVRFAVVQGIAILFGTAILGFNPYVTNAVHRGHPFYPWMGSAQYPSYADRGRDPNEMYETPKNLLADNRFVRFSYALFGRPGAQPFFPDKEAHLMWPFDIRWNDFAMFYFHDVRISGFGPLFSGAFLIAVALLVAGLMRPGFDRTAVLVLLGAIVASLLIGAHMWWARYGPQLWWLPVICIVVALASPAPRLIRAASWGVGALLLVNCLLIAIVHFRWEAHATRTTYEQAAFLRQKQNIEINFPYFEEPYSERLRRAGVSFRTVPRLTCSNPMELMSVPPGYPGAVQACVGEQ